MDQSDVRSQRIRNLTLLGAAAIISWWFWKLIAPFAMALLMAAVFAAMSQPLKRWFMARLKDRAGLASMLTLLVVLLVIIIPAIFFVVILAGQAVQISQSVGPWINDQVANPEQLEATAGRFLRNLPVVGDLLPSTEAIVRKLGEIAGRLGSFLVQALAAATKGTVTFFLQLFVMLYAMFYFLLDGSGIIARLKHLSPLDDAQEDALIARFVSITRATLKGTLVIGLVQGGLAGLAFFVVGIDGSVFWGTIMGVLSIIPALGASLVWIPAVIVLLATGKIAAGIGLAVWCAVVVGSSDNVLRPLLVGRDTQMPDVLVLLSTLGGIGLFGILGVIVGPIIAGLFLTVWDQYGEAFDEYLKQA